MATAQGSAKISTFRTSRECRVAVPPPDEQAAIVRFLDWANGRLERAIRAKRKVIALLNEQKQAIIHRAVTRGLDPSVPLKPSGIPWLGDIPQHWEMRRMRLPSTQVTTDGWADAILRAEVVAQSLHVKPARSALRRSTSWMKVAWKA